MIIRSQDKKSITTDLNIRIYEDDWTHSFEISNNADMELGLYSTEARAIKVLDMIQSDYVCHKGGIWYFQMPQDSEV